MSMPLVILMVILMVSSYVILIYLTKQHLVIALVLLTSFWVIVLFFGFGWVYFVNPALSKYINTFIRPVETHLTYGGGRVPLPLPPATALNFRYSHEGAGYYSRLSMEKVIEFYSQQVPGVEIQSRKPDEWVGIAGVRLLLMYKEAMYSVLVTPTGRSASYILVESIPPDR